MENKGEKGEKTPNFKILSRDTRPRTCVSEKLLEARLRKEVKALGGEAVKLTSQYHRGLPDRLVLMPHGLTYFVELKTTGQVPSALQLRTHDQLIDMGFPVMVIDSHELIDTFLEILRKEQKIMKDKKQH